MKRLNIVVPFRAREAHLTKFVPTVRAYFARDKLDCDIPYRVVIVEQDNEFPFNRGALNNIGFLLGRDDSDYTCFHDVDYLPIWADYSWSDVPSAILWYGAESRKIAPGRSAATVHHPDMNPVFGGVQLVPNTILEEVNGHANSYWGWGNEDIDLRYRFRTIGITTSRRKGTFEPLEHDHEGYEIDGSSTPIAIVNEQIFQSRWSEGADNHMHDDGLNSLAYEILSRRTVPEGPVVERPASWEIVTVRLRMQPLPEQLAAVAKRNMARGLAAPSAGLMTVPRDLRISRNAPCPCGSGKKFKRCHGA